MKKYSIVTYLEGQAKQAVRNIQQELFEITGSRECLDTWSPHLTVGNGIEVSEEQMSDLEKVIAKFTESQAGFNVELSGFGGLDNRVGGKGEVTTPFVLWVGVVVNEQLRKLVQEIEQTITSQCELWYKMPLPYTPHVTVAFRDLSKEGYQSGLTYLNDKNFSGTVSVSHIALVEKLPDTDIEYKRFEFGRPT
ncbi:2'-5' RNA ligase family protein [Candidatus Nomurabacteria bacterium]|nr:2'-5' RNA ligase family protein [Candidatus Kaiserbacteria bacterium]MCB9815738.1 2'-5' RNA ligase family protein [Candidatus Nomurabacteria bacterium]